MSSQPQQQNPPSGSKLRHLVACPHCQLQFDASGRPPGSRFHCGCGKLLTVPQARPHHASVVRCSSCGGPRMEESTCCQFCHADFTLHERDLHTICPGCMTRIANRARFCHHCGVPITPQAPAGEDTDYGCPVCEGHKLTSRTLGGDQISVLECGKCGGLWLGHELFGLLQERAALKEISWLKGAGSEAGQRTATGARPGGAVYRRCIVCQGHMNRQNFKRKSGVIVDICPSDGVWFDLGELDRILHWIQSGGLSRAREMTARRKREEDRNRKLRRPFDPLERAAAAEFGPSRDAEGRSPDFVGGLISFFLD